MLVDAHRPASRVGRVEERLGCRIGVGGPEHARPEPVARDHVGLVQRQVGDELDRPTGAIGREVLAEPVQPGCHGQQPHVDGPGHHRRRAIARARRRLPEHEDGRSGVTALGCSRELRRRRAVSTDWRWGRTTRPVGWSVAPRRSTSTVRSVAATVRGRDHGAATRRCGRGQRRGVPEEEPVPGAHRTAVGRACRASGSSGSSVTSTMSDHAHALAADRADRASAGADSPRSGSTSPGRRADQPGALLVVADGEGDGDVGRRGVLVPERGVVDVPRRATCTAAEPVGSVGPGLGEPERDTGRTRRRWPGRPGRVGPPCSDLPRRRLAVSNERSAGTSAKRCRREATSTAASDNGRPRSRSPVNGSIRRRLRRRAGPARRRPGSPGRARPAPAGGRRRVPRPRTACPARRRPRRVALAAVEGKAQAPPRHEVVGIDEPRAVAHVAPEVQRGDGRPVGPVAQALLGDAPERVARAAPRGPSRRRGGGPSDAERSPRRGARRRRGPARRAGALAPRARGHARGAPTVVSASTPTAIRAARRSTTEAPAGTPTSPLRTWATTARRAGRSRPPMPPRPPPRARTARRVGQGAPGVPEPARERIADHEDEHGRDGGEGEQGGEHRRRDVEHPAAADVSGRAIHRRDRSRSCRSASPTPTTAR